MILNIYDPNKQEVWYLCDSDYLNRTYGIS